MLFHVKLTQQLGLSNAAGKDLKQETCLKLLMDISKTLLVQILSTGGDSCSSPPCDESCATCGRRCCHFRKTSYIH